MSQNDFTLANQGFPSMRADMNSAYQALASNNSGSTAPTTTFAHQWWYDTANSKLMIRNAANTLFEEFAAGGGGIVYVEKTANYTAAAGEGIIADTSAGSWTLTLPATPTSGDVVVVADGANWAINNLTIGRNGSTIEGDSSDLIMNIGNVSVTFIYASNNWQIYSQMGAPAGVVVTEDGTQTLTNKTIGSSQLTGALPAIDGSALTGLSAGALTFISSSDISDDATVDFTGFNASLYDSYEFVFLNVGPKTDTAELFMRTSTDGGSSYESGTNAYKQSVIYRSTNDSSARVSNANTTEFQLTAAPLGTGSDPATPGQADNIGVSGVINVLGPHITTARTRITQNIFYTRGSVVTTQTGGGETFGNTPVDAVRFFMSSGNIGYGTITMYGRANS